MTDRATVLPLEVGPNQTESSWVLLRQLLVLATPVFAEHTLHVLVGWTDTYLANQMHRYDVQTEVTRAAQASAGAAVGTMAYILWFVGLLVSAVGSGSTAIIARAKGARHRSLANSICGQSVTLALGVGVVSGVLAYIFAGGVADLSGLDGQAHDYARTYLRILAPALPFTMVMFIANACLRGAGDTLSPAITMIIVDVINMAVSSALTYGWLGLPRMGFEGIAAGTMVAYVAGGVIQFTVLIRGRGGVRLFIHRLLPDTENMKRLLRIGLPGGAADFMHWLANFGVVRFINEMGATASNAHNITIRIESMSYMLGFAVATAAATMVGQSLGMKQPRRAQRSAFVAYALAGGIMTTMGIGFIFLGKYPAMLFSSDPEIQRLVTGCLFVTGFIQSGFAGALVFGGALRGAGDTFAVMLLLLVNMFLVRMLGVFLVAHVFHLGLVATWMVLSSELMLRGIVMFGRFIHGGWKRITV